MMMGADSRVRSRARARSSGQDVTSVYVGPGMLDDAGQGVWHDHGAEGNHYHAFIGDAANTRHEGAWHEHEGVWHSH